MHVEEAMDAFLRRLVPNFDAAWTAASEQEIAEIEALAGRPLPAFYGWFLATMGGSFRQEREDLRAATVLHAYREGVVQPDPRFLLIGRISDPVMPELIFYDLDAPCRDDAMVVKRLESGPPWRRTFETLRESLAWGMMLVHRVFTAAQWCRGSFTADGSSVLAQLDPVMKRLGFSSPIETGSFCGLYEREGAAMACMDAVEDADGDLQFFRIGGPDTGELRRILGEIATETSIDVRITQWEPPLPQ